MAEVVSMPPMEESAEDREAKELLAQWGNDDSAASDDASVDEPTGDYDDDLEKFRRDVYPKDNELDHIVLATSDLELAMDNFEKLTGERPVMVVSLNGLGTKSARIAFENCCFLEIIAPDPKQTYRPLGDKLTHLEPGKLVPLHYAVRNKDAEELKDEDWSDLGFSCDKVTMVAKDRGMPWQWDLYFLEGHDDGGIVPYFTHWGKSHHAAGRLPILGSLDKVTVRAPADNKVHKLLEEVKGLTTEEGDNFFEFTFTSKTGSHTFSGSSLIGVSFPLAGGIPVQE